LSNFKIITTAILYRLIIKQKLTRQQWFALSLLSFGGLSYSLGIVILLHIYSRGNRILWRVLLAKECMFNVVLLGILKNSTQIISASVMSEMYIHPIGIPMVVTYCMLSGLANVYTEWILKKNYSQSLHLQNVFLYTYGTLLNMVVTLGVILITYSAIDLTNIFNGFSIYTWLIVLSQAFNGLFMSVVIKHTSNIIRLFVISFSLIVTTILSMTIFHMTLNIWFFISFGTMFFALSLYYKYWKRFSWQCERLYHCWKFSADEASLQSSIHLYHNLHLEISKTKIWINIIYLQNIFYISHCFFSIFMNINRKRLFYRLVCWEWGKTGIDQYSHRKIQKIVRIGWAFEELSCIGILLLETEIQPFPAVRLWPGLFCLVKKKHDKFPMYFSFSSVRNKISQWEQSISYSVIPFSERKGYTTVKFGTRKYIKFVYLSVQANQNSARVKPMSSQQQPS
jgi:hypothetical protein